MKSVLNIIIEVTTETLYGIRYFIKSNLQNFATILNTALPYAMFYIGQGVALREDKLSVFNPEIAIIPLFIFILIFYIKSTANKLGKGTTVPIPDKRFTEVKDDGEVSIENGRVQELILYLADLEDWLERKGLL